MEYRFDLTEIAMHTEHEDQATRSNLAIAERLEAQVEVMQQILEAVNKWLAEKPVATPDFRWQRASAEKPESADWKPSPDNLGPCGGPQ